MTSHLDFPIIVELARKKVDELLNRNLYDAEIAALQCAWDFIDYQDFAEDTNKFTNLYSELYRFPKKNKKVGSITSSSSRILKLLSEVYDVKLTRNNFRRNLQELWDAGDIDKSDLDSISHSNESSDEIETLDVADTLDLVEIDDYVDLDREVSFIGRGSDLHAIEMLLEKHPIIALYGAPGIGKTTFINRLSKIIDSKYSVFYTDLRYIKDFQQWGYNVLSQARFYDEVTNDTLAAKILELLESKPTLVIIDSVINLDQEIAAFLETFAIRNQNLVHCIISSPKKISLKISSQYVHYYHLKGLESFSDIKLFYQSLDLQSPESWEDMNSFYEGNFREIIYVARFINDFFEGDVSAYWASDSRIISPETSQNFDAVKFTQLDINIFSMFAADDNVISSNIMQALRKDSRTSEICARINYLCDLGYLIKSREGQNNRLIYSIAPLLKCYLIQENIIDSSQ